MPSLTLRPSHKAVAAYYESLAAFKTLGTEHELAVKTAFATLLEVAAKPFGWKLVAEHSLRAKGGKRIQPDGTLTVTSSTLCASAPLREANPAAGETATAVPTFALLRDKRRLAVCNPENGARFTVSLRDWQETLWAVRVHPEPGWEQPENPYTTAHRLLPRRRLEEWLAELRLAGPE